MPSFLDREGVAILLVALLVLVLLAAGAYVLIYPPTSSTPKVEQPAADTVSDAVTRTPKAIATRDFVYPGEEGKTVLELLKRDHVVRLDSELLLFGSIVLQIDSFVAAPDQYWIYYRDSLRGDRSPEVCTTLAGESVRWVLARRR